MARSHGTASTLSGQAKGWLSDGRAFPKGCSSLASNRVYEEYKILRVLPWVLTDLEAGFRRVYSAYRSRAHRKNLAWELTTEQALILLSSPCVYCGCGPERPVYPRGVDRRWVDESLLFWRNGIDRTDNTKGYVPGNVKTACTLCNEKKSDMPEDVFLDWVRRVYEHRETR